MSVINMLIVLMKMADSPVNVKMVTMELEKSALVTIFFYSIFVTYIWLITCVVPLIKDSKHSNVPMYFRGLLLSNADIFCFNRMLVV